MRQTTREFTIVSAWPKGITVGNWREEGCAAQSLIRSYSFISTTVDKAQLVVLRLVFSISGQEFGLGKRLRTDLFCVEWDNSIKPAIATIFAANKDGLASAE